jgi:predicted small secreted protein
MKKGIVACMLIALLALLVTGCVTNKEDIQLMSKTEAARYARKNFGKAEVISSDTSEDTVIYTLQDEEYGFTYTIRHYIYRVVIDASVTGFYSDAITSDFSEKYQEHILAEIAPDNVARDVMGANRAGHDVLVWLNYNSEAEARAKLPRVADQIRSVDKRGYFKEYGIGAYAGETNLGTYYMGTDQYVSDADDYAEQMMYHFSVEVNHNSSDHTGITYLYCERVQYKDVERLQMEWLHDKDAAPEDWTVAYYFDYEGQTYFMLDDIVFIRDAEGIEGNHLSDYYTSYWFN